MSQAERKRYEEKTGVTVRDPERVALNDYNAMLLRAYILVSRGVSRETALNKSDAIAVLQKVYEVPGGIDLEYALLALDRFHSHANTGKLCQTDAQHLKLL